MDKIAKFFKILGPGLISGAADDDPSGIATYSQTGAQFGYQQLWTQLFTTPFMIVIQEMVGRIGLVTGKDLGWELKRNFPNWLVFISVSLLFIANIINLGADLGAMASSLQLLLNLNLFIWLFMIAVFIILSQIFIPYKVYTNILQFLTLAFLAYLVTAFITKQAWGEILKDTFVPYVKFSKDYFLNIAALLGTSISPYLFFWQTSQEAEDQVSKHRIREINKGKPKLLPGQTKGLKIDTIIGMIVANLVAFFIIITASSTLMTHGVTSVDTASQAAKALSPIAGQFAETIFTIGILGGGLLAVPVLAGSLSFAISDIFQFHVGLEKKLKRAPQFYGLIICAIIAGLLINLTPIEPFKLLYYSAVINGIAAPLIIVLVILLSNNPKVMKNHTNSLTTNILGWVIAAVMAAAGLASIISVFLK